MLRREFLHRVAVAVTGILLPGAAKPTAFVPLQDVIDVAAAIKALDITTIQWETTGGMHLNFKIYEGIKFPCGCNMVSSCEKHRQGPGLL